MAWLAVDLDETELIFELIPERSDRGDWIQGCDYVLVPKGSIEKLIGKELTWDDEPVELK